MINAICPNCHQSHAVDAISKEELERALEKVKPKEVNIEKIAGALVDELLNKIPDNLGTFCDQFPQLCQRVNQLQSQVKEIDQTLKSHPAPSESLLDTWRNCPSCKSKAEAMGLISKEEAEPPFAFMKR